MLDRKGLFTFLLITFGLTYAIEGGLILSGFRVTDIPPLYGQFIIMGVMWVPALATVLTIALVTKEGFGITNFRIGPLLPYISSALLVPAVFIVIYALTWMLGLGEPDWELRDFLSLIASAAEDPIAIPPSTSILAALFLSSLIIGPTINGLFGFGEEFGWRGYLLPKLLPLGKPKAYLLLGVIWGFWHAPLVLIGFNYPGYPILGVIFMAALTSSLGIYLNEMTLRQRSSILAGWIHGAFNGQGYGIWRILFPNVNPLLGGMTGFVGIVVWLLLGLWYARRG